jgi:hypothetical protein
MPVRGFDFAEFHCVKLLDSLQPVILSFIDRERTPKKCGGVAGAPPPQRGVVRNEVRTRGEASPLNSAGVLS